MKIQNTYTIIPWLLVIVLLTTNIVTIFSVRSKNDNIEYQKQEAPNPDQIPDNSRMQFFNDQLNLTSEQQRSFREYYRNYHQDTRTLTRDMRVLRFKMLQELDKEKPDSIALRTIASDIGKMHEKMKWNTMQYYLNMKQQCSPEQSQRLKMIFNSMLKGDPQMIMDRKGRHRHGQRNRQERHEESKQ